ncbi:MAG: hypothetical protein U0570_15770 [Phycisphaerales bacterium]
MSRAAALIWLLIALLLAGIVWWTSPRASFESAATPLLTDFSPGNVTSVGLEWPDGQRATIERSVVQGRWILRPSPTLAWPIDSERMQGLLRILAEARRQTAAEARPMPSAIFLTLQAGSKAPLRVAVDPQALGGAGRVAVVGADGTASAVGSVDESFVRALDRSAIETWRSRDALFWPAEATAAVSSRSKDAYLQLAKAGGGWTIQAPLLARADTGVVQGALLYLSKASVERFLPADAVPSADWANPERRVTLAAAFRARPDAPSTEVESIWEVGPAVSGQAHAVRMMARETQSGEVLWGPLVGVVDNAVLRAIPQVPESVLSRLVAEFPGADVSAVELTCPTGNFRAAREGDGGFGASDGTIRELLKVLTESPAAQTRIVPEEEPPDDAIQCRLMGPRDQALASVRLRASVTPSKVTGAPATSAIEVRDGAIVRLIPWSRPGEFLATLKSLCQARKP